MGHDTEFSDENAKLLKEAGVSSKTPAEFGAATGPFKVEWKQVKKQSFGNTSESYYVCKFAETGPNGKVAEGGKALERDYCRKGWNRRHQQVGDH